MTDEKKLIEIIKRHKKWILGEEGGEFANLSGANLSGADLSGTDLSEVNLRWANLSEVNLRGANLRWANLSGADLSGADLIRADLSGTDLSGANLSEADLSEVNLIGANLSGAKGILSSVDFMKINFEKTKEGYIAYKTFGSERKSPGKWDIRAGSVIDEVVNFNRCNACGCGINVAPLEFVKNNYKGEIWKVLIRWEWLCGVCVPYNTDGKIRCERVELLEVVER